MPSKLPASANVVPIGAVTSKQRSRTNHPASAYKVEDPPPPPSDLADTYEPVMRPPAPNPWDLDQILDPGDYDTNAFYTASSVGEEGTRKITATVPSQISYQISSIVETRRFYPHIGTASDVLRDALVHWLHKRKSGLSPEHEAELQRDLARHRYMSRVQSRRRRQAEVEEMLEATVDVLEQAKSLGDESMMREALADARAQVEVMMGPNQQKMVEIIGRFEEKVNGS